MTLPQQSPDTASSSAPNDPSVVAPAPTVPSGRGLASAIAVFLGGYLLLASFAGTQLLAVSSSLFAPLMGREPLQMPVAYSLLLALQFLFAIVVVVVGLLIGRGPLVGRLLGSLVVVVGSLATVLVLGARLSGAVRFPGGEAGIPFQMLFANPWFAIVLIVGVAWLLSRGARLGWLSLLPVLVLIPLPTVFTLNGIESGVMALVLFFVSALIGAGIIAAGRPLRD